MRDLTTASAEYKRLRKIFLEADAARTTARAELQMWCPHNEGVDRYNNPHYDMLDEYCKICGKQVA